MLQLFSGMVETLVQLNSDMKELVKRMRIRVSGSEFWFTIQEKLGNQGTGKETILREEILHKVEVTELND